MMEVEKLQSIPADAANIFFSSGGFEQRPLAYAAGVGLAAGAGVVAARYKQMKAESEALRLPDPDMEEVAKRHNKRHRIGMAAAGLAAVTALSSGVAHEAGPYTEESNSLIETAAVVVDTSWNAYARDVDDGGENTTRIQAAVNGINRLENLSGVDVTFVAAGREAEKMGSINGQAGRNEVVDNFERYIGQYRNRSEADLSGALAIANALEADKVLMFTGSVTGVESELYSEENPDRVSVVAPGVSGTTVNYIGSEREAELNHAANEQIVGTENAYTATSIEEVQSIVSDIANEQYVEIERDDFDGFETIRNISGAALAAGVALHALKGVVRPSARKRIKGDK